MRIALVSLDQVWQDRAANLARCRVLATSAAAQGASLVIFPEMTLTGFSLDMERVAESAAGSPSLAAMAELARACGVDLLFGASLIQAEDATPRNTLCLARPGQAAEALYAKMHPFSFAGEDRALRAGDALGRAELGDLRLGCSVCYDLRFPELYSLMAASCNAVVNIANWPSRRVAHWRALLVARAIENQYFVIGVNRTGSDGNGLNYVKSSMVVAPDGEVLTPAVGGEELDLYDLDLDQVAHYRAQFPTVSDKRYALYKALY